MTNTNHASLVMHVPAHDSGAPWVTAPVSLNLEW